VSDSSFLISRCWPCSSSPYAYFGTYSVAGLFLNLLAIPLAGIVVPATLALGIAGSLIPVDAFWQAPAWINARALESFFNAGIVAQNAFPLPELPRFGITGILMYFILLYGGISLWPYVFRRSETLAPCFSEPRKT
jgi:hypothetical protein